MRKSCASRLLLSLLLGLSFIATPVLAQEDDEAIADVQKFSEIKVTGIEALLREGRLGMREVPKYYFDLDWERCRGDLRAMILGTYRPNRTQMLANGQRGECFDLHTAYLNVDELKELLRESRGNFQGIGIEITHSCKLVPGGTACRVVVFSVFDDSPASSAGFRSGDVLITATDESGVAQIIDNIVRAVTLIRGEPDTEVTVGVMRDGVEIQLTALRANVHVSAVMARLYEDMCHVWLRQFTAEVADDMEKAIRDECGGSSDNIILDLRDDPGGLTTAAAEVLYDFTSDPDRLLYRIHSRDDVETHTVADPTGTGCERARTTSDGRCQVFSHPATGEPKLPGIFARARVAVIINGNSASASELVSGALQSWQRAGTLVPPETYAVFGTMSFGKVHQQVVLPLGDDTAMKYTTSEFVPGYRNSVPPGTGIQPDFVVEGQRREIMAGPDSDVQLRVAMSWLRRVNADVNTEINTGTR
jgi:carboxyl-terminal processing protease